MEHFNIVYQLRYYRHKQTGTLTEGTHKNLAFYKTWEKMIEHLPIHLDKQIQFEGTRFRDRYHYTRYGPGPITKDELSFVGDELRAGTVFALRLEATTRLTGTHKIYHWFYITREITDFTDSDAVRSAATDQLKRNLRNDSWWEHLSLCDPGLRSQPLSDAQFRSKAFVHQVTPNGLDQKNQLKKSSAQKRASSDW